MAQVTIPPVSDAAIAEVLEELRRVDPGQSPLGRFVPKEANVEGLHRATGLARGTVHNAITRLTPVLRSRRYRDSTAPVRRGGKPTTLYQLAPRAGEALVLDVDHDRISAWKADPFGNLLGLGEARIDVDESAKDAVLTGTRLLQKVPASDWQNVVGIGVSIPAPVDPDTHRAHGGVLRSWEDVDLEGILREQLGDQIARRQIAILADNDANLAALAEYRSLESTLGPGNGPSNLILVKTVPGPIGIGAGAIINGQQLRGKGFAMELGHLSIDGSPEGVKVVECPHCRRTNCLQARISTDALIGGQPAPAWDDVVRWTRENLHAIRGARKNAEAASDLAEVDRLNKRLSALADTDPNTKAIILAGEEMGRALAKVVILLDPDVIAFEGALARAWLDDGAGSVREVVGDPLRKTLSASMPLSRSEPVVLALATSAGNCARGAAAAVFDSYFIEFVLRRIRL